MANHPSQLQDLRILILDDEATIRLTLRLCLEAAGHRVVDFATGNEAISDAASHVYDLLFLDLRLGTQNGLDLLPQFLAQSPWLKVVVITAYASIDTAVEAMRRGALDYLPKPFTPEQVELLAAKVAQLRSMEMRISELQDALGNALPETIFNSANHTMCEALELARNFAASKAAIVMVGESGTGKRTLARAIHDWSPRRQGPFLAETCAGRSEEELVMALFGQMAQRRMGCIERCNAGTLYLDDIGELPPQIQLSLVQLIQSGTFEPEDANAPLRGDARMVLGAAEPLKALVEKGNLREDLYYALASKSIEIPTLRKRPEDISPLAELYLAFYGRQSGKAITGYTKEAMEYLHHYAWPGNLRELRNVVERAVILARQHLVGIQDLPPNMIASASHLAVGDLVPLEAVEEMHIRGILAKTRSLESAAKILGIDYATLWRRRRRYGL